MNVIHRLLYRLALYPLLLLIGWAMPGYARDVRAVWLHQTLIMEIPYHVGHAGGGRLTVEMLNPEDEVLGRSERQVDAVAGDGVWKQEVSSKTDLSLHDVAWHRVRYRFQYNGETSPAIDQVESLGAILRRPVLHVLGQRTYLAGAQAAIRIVVVEETEAASSSAAGSGSVRIELVKTDDRQNGKPRQLFAGKLDHHGSADAEFRFPENAIGEYSLHIVADTAIGAVETTQPVELQDKVSVLLTTEKPVYQPSQIIHARVLALNRAAHHAAADRRLTFELQDSRGNKVFRRGARTDAFGVASAEFPLADEVNLGTYRLTAIVGDPETPTDQQELDIQVQRYVLPKFRVALDLEQKDGKPRRDYRPGEHITGTIHAMYFFGKPVDNAPVNISVHGMDVSLFVAAHAEGRTNERGDYRFDVTLPAYMAGKRQYQGAAPVVIEAAVKDTAGHAETREESITVSQSPLLLTAIPEGGNLIPGIENQVFVLASYPDGTPAQSAITLRIDGNIQRISTDTNGVAIAHITPAAQSDRELHIEAVDLHGSRASNTVTLEQRYGEEQVLLRTEHAIYKPGDRLSLSLFSTRKSGTAYVDLVKDGQTILTRDVEIVNGRAELSLRVTPQMAGTLQISAYVFGRNAQTIEDRRTIFVQPADELHIRATADAASYLPGSEARVRFHVTNARGEGVQASLGLEVVDEAVFALAEKHPGFARVFFYLEQELLKPRYEIHSLSMSDSVVPLGAAHEEAHDRAARVLFCAAESVGAHTLRADVGAASKSGWNSEFRNRYQSTYMQHVRALLKQLAPGNGRNFLQRFAAIAESDGKKPHDAWSTPLRAEAMSDGRQGRSTETTVYRIVSAGPDRAFGTDDDLSVVAESRFGDVFPLQRAGDMDVKLEHNRGPETQYGEIFGAITDPSGAVIPEASIVLRSLDRASIRRVTAGEDGGFTFSAIPAGRYRLEIGYPGFRSAAREITLQPRDRAVVSCSLQLGMVMEAVTVMAAAPLIQTESASLAAVPLNGRNVGRLAPMAAAKSVAQGGMEDNKSGNGAETTQARVRSYFPEALYINPSLITDGTGHASITIPMADSITTWRMAMTASTKAGALGGGNASLKVFQEFFADLDLPVTLTQGDEVTIPVAAYNYSGSNGAVILKLRQEDWFELSDDSTEKDIMVQSGKVGGGQFTLRVKKLGKFKLTLAAHLHGERDLEDIVEREIEVVPNGQRQELAFNGRLESTAKHTVRFPRNALPDASKLFIRFYPGPLSQVIEGMDGILSMPGGCFEQTSSSTYPNVLALDYMKRTKKLVPEVHARAEGYIANGYQRLLTFEVAGGGFSWFGQAPANKILTAYGLMEFADMSHVHDVDPRLIERTAQWLAAQQQPDGSWKPDTYFINEGATNRYNSDLLRITAYLGWAMEVSGYHGDAVKRARGYVASHLGGVSGKTDPYTLAVLANFAVDGEKDPALTRRILELLLNARIDKGDQTWWAGAETGVYGAGESAAVETTGLAVQALLKSNDSPDVSRRALAWLLSKKSASGNWGTTQATIMALRALLLASEASAGSAQGRIQVLLNGNPIQELALTPENNDLLHQIVVPQTDLDAENNIELRFSGSGSMAYQIAGRYFTAWPQMHEAQPLSIDVAYDRTTLAQNDLVTATATVHNTLDKTANMVMVDLGIPPGFDLQTEDLQAMVEKTAHARTGKLEKFSLTATQAILYFNAIGAGDTVRIPFRLRAKYPIRAKGFASRVYEYYDPSVHAMTKPVQFEVKGK